MWQQPLGSLDNQKFMKATSDASLSNPVSNCLYEREGRLQERHDCVCSYGQVGASQMHYSADIGMDIQGFLKLTNLVAISLKDIADHC